MARIRSRVVETESVNQRMLRRGAVKRQHISRWAVGHDELAPGVVGDTHLHPTAIERIREVAADGAAGSGQLLVMSATGNAIASGGDYVTFDQIVAQTGFTDVSVAGSSFTHPISATYVLSYEHAWDGFDGGGTIRIEIDGVLIEEGVIAQGTSGRTGSETIEYFAKAGAVGRIKVSQFSGASEFCDAVLRIAVPDPTDGVTAIPAWALLFAADAWGIVHDGSSWWTTAGLSSAQVTERDSAGAALSTFAASDVTTPRGITFDGTNLWIHGELDGEVACYSPAGVLVSSFNYYPAWNESTGSGIAFDGTDLWIVGRNTKEIRRYSTAGVHLQTISLATMTTPQDVAYHAGRLYIVDGGTADQIVVYTTAGASVEVIDVSDAPTSQPFGVWIGPAGELFISEDGVGVFQRVDPVV